MIQNIEQIKEVAQKETFASEISVFISNLIAQDQEKALYVAKTLFFSPEIHPQVRYKIGTVLGRFKNPQIFNQILSHFILRNFPDRMALICALKSFANMESVPALKEYYREASYREKLEIIDALAAVQTPETVEFLSQIYNQQIEYVVAPEEDELPVLRDRASSALSKNIMRFDMF